LINIQITVCQVINVLAEALSPDRGLVKYERNQYQPLV